MADLMTIEVDNRALLSALDRLGSAIERFTKPAAKITADAIHREARARVARRTGATAGGILVEETRDRAGYVVLATAVEPRVIAPNMPPRQREALARLPRIKASRKPVPIWLEFGTDRMAPRPFFFASADLERGAHDRRTREAIQAGIDAEGLGA